MKLKLAFGIASAAMLLCACGDDSLTTIQDEAKDKGMVTLKVVDYNTGDVLDSAEIYSLIDAKTAFTDSLGIVSWEDEVIGDYEYTVSKEGYATRTVKVTLQENSGGDMARVEDRIREVKMYKKGVSVKGTVLLRDPQSGNLSAASKVKVVLSYENDFILPSEIATLTDSSGVYEFKNLAEGLSYAVRVPQASVNGKTYAWASEKTIEEALRSGEQRVLDQVTMEVVGLDPELIKDNLQTIGAEEAVKLTFSTALLADSVPTSWKVYKGSANAMAGAYLDENGNLIYGNVCTTGTSVLTSATLDEEDGKTVIISPISEKWTRLATYCLYGVAYTSEGKGVSIAKTFIPGSAVSRPSLVTELAASDYYGRYIMLSWKPTGEEVKGYKVYYKTSESADFEEYTSWDANRLTLPIDSSACKNVSDDDDCPQVEELDKSYARSEINYWFHTDSTKTEVTALDDYNRTDYTFTWTTSSALDSVTCNSSSYTYSTLCADQIATYGTYTTRTYFYDAEGDYVYDDDNDLVYVYKWRFNKTLETPVTCKSTNYYYYDDATCYEIYLEIGSAPDRSVNYYMLTYTDSTSCTVTNGYFDDNKKCVALKEEFGNYSSINYNYWWYTEEVPIKPEAKSFSAFVTTNNVVSDETSSVKFVVLPYVVVGGDTVLADAVKATRAEYKITTEN